MKKILEKIIEILGTKYTIINAYNGEEVVNPDGVIAVQMTNCEIIHNGPYQDKKYTFTISGQTITDEDINQKRIVEMFEFVENKDFNALMEMDGVAGFIYDSSDMSSNGETNNFTFTFSVFYCQS